MPESFFDFRSRVTKPAAAEADDARLDRALSVAQLNGQIDAAIRGTLPATVLVRGEISNLNIHAASGHIYFTLKDDKSGIDCVMFRGEAAKLKQRPTDGGEVLVTGNVRVYLQRGRYQLYCQTMTPLGRGALELKFQQLQQRLEAEGLFDAERKRRLPPYPQRIVIVTSRQAAALQDILKVFQRTPWLRPKLIHVPVQGPGSAAQMAAALASLTPAVADVVILGRGGGSLEDLWEFNEETVARAIVTCAVPVVTGIGHEVDVSIADLAADYHAHTPTEAAQVVLAHWRQADLAIDGATERLDRAFRQGVERCRRQLANVERHEMFRRPTDRINRLRETLDDRGRQLKAALAGVVGRCRSTLTRQERRLQAQHPVGRILRARQRVETLHERLRHAQTLRLARLAGRLEAFGAQLNALDSRRVLGRGYTITRTRSGKVLTSPGDVAVGETIVTQTRDGTVESTVRDTKQMDLF